MSHYCQRSTEQISGASKVDVSFEKKQAVVTYDDAKTNIESLVKATTNDGSLRRAEYRLRKQAAQLGFQIMPA